MEVSDLGEKLDKLIALYQLANSEALEAARSNVRSDAVVAEILAIATEWISTGDAKRQVASARGVNEKTVQRRIAELVDMGILAKRGGGPSVQVRSTGVV